MAQELINKKTGTTPIIEEGLGGGEVSGVVELKAIMIKMRDGHGKDMVRLALVVPGGDVLLLDEAALKAKPAQSWVRASVLRHLSE